MVLSDDGTAVFHSNIAFRPACCCVTLYFEENRTRITGYQPSVVSVFTVIHTKLLQVSQFIITLFLKIAFM